MHELSLLIEKDPIVCKTELRSGANRLKLPSNRGFKLSYTWNDSIWNEMEKMKIDFFILFFGNKREKFKICPIACLLIKSLNNLFREKDSN